MTSSRDWVDRYLAVAIENLSKRHALDVLDRIQAGEVGCVDCGHTGPRGTFQRGKRGRGRICPVCGLDVDANGFVDGDSLGRDLAAQLPQIDVA